ncbi:MAG: hypothetical protein KME08_09315 [Aphanothece sp. CMT-3BRIN-NPC111]|nr:hypothetical protein [Aphanothece sp. CMT-3BRIN-NPC111]
MKGIPNILWHYIRSKYGRRFRSREELLTWQDKKVRNFLTYILPKSQFYRSYYQGLNARDWQQFPLIDKSTMMANFDQLNTAEIKKSEAFYVALEAEKTRDFSSTIGKFTVGLSSGTSGNRGLFIVSEQEQCTWAGTILAKALPQSIIARQRIGFFLRANSKLYQTVNRKRIQFEYFDLLFPLKNHIERLNQYLPTILIAPPSMLRLLAEAQARGSLNISPLKIISVAEVLDPLDEGYICHVFNQIVHQLYQCTEGFLAATCAYGTIHLNEDIVAIQKEYLDKDAGKFIPIITDFCRTTQPIIRYRLDDILTEQETPCLCGSVFTPIKSIEGRCDDIFYLKSQQNEKLVPIFPDFIRRAIITASTHIQEYIVVQKSTDLIEISLNTPAELQAQVQAQVYTSLLFLFERLNCKIPEVRYQEYRTTRQLDKKLRRVHREF